MSIRNVTFTHLNFLRLTRTQPIFDKLDALPSNDDVGSTQEILNSRFALFFIIMIVAQASSTQTKLTKPKKF